MSLPAQLALLAGAFAGGALVAELAGAANLGVALGIGQIAFVAALVLLLLRRREGAAPRRGGAEKERRREGAARERPVGGRRRR